MGGLYPIDTDDERDRYFNKGSVTRELIEKIRYDIYDYESFVELLKNAFSEDASLHGLINHPNFEDNSFRTLFSHPLIQKWIKINDHDRTIKYISRQSRVSIAQARDMFNRLTERDKSRVRIASTQKRKITIKKRQEKPKKRLKRITQISKAGTTYRRSKPQRWTELQVRFLNNNRQERVARLLEIYNLLFPEIPRTESSLKNKLYRESVRRTE